MLKFGKVEAHRNTKNTAAVVQTPVSNGGGLGAGRCGESGGNGRGDHGVFVGVNMESNRAFNRRHQWADSPAGVASCGRAIWGEEEEG